MHLTKNKFLEYKYIHIYIKETKPNIPKAANHDLYSQSLRIVSIIHFTMIKPGWSQFTKFNVLQKYNWQL